MILSVDTSSSKGGLSLFNDNTLIFEESWGKEKSHSDYLTSCFEKHLQKFNIKTSDITKILCAYGPGSFTGLRVGLNFSKSLAFCHNAELLLTPSFRNQIPIQELEKNKTLTHLVLLNAFKNQVFAGIYKFEGDVLNETLFDRTFIPEKLDSILNLNTKYLVWGDGLEIYKDSINEVLKSNFSPQSETDLNPSCLQYSYFLNYDHCLKFIKIDPLSAEPLYIKKSEAEENLSLGKLKRHTQRNL